MKEINKTKNATCRECGQNVHQCQCPMAKTKTIKKKNEKN